MLACHASQRNWLLKQHGIDEYLESCRRWSASRGAQIGASSAKPSRSTKGIRIRATTYCAKCWANDKANLPGRRLTLGPGSDETPARSS